MVKPNEHLNAPFKDTIVFKKTCFETDMTWHDMFQSSSICVD